jgi:hypothetical protein
VEKANNISELLKVCNPEPLSGTDFNKFHVNTSLARGNNSALNLTNYLKINKDDFQKILFMGHRGSGKTTELWQVQENLKSDFWIISFSIKNEIDSIDLKYIDLVFLILSKLLEIAQSQGIITNEFDPILQNIENYWKSFKQVEQITSTKSEVKVESEAKASSGLLAPILSLMLSIKGVFSASTDTKKTLRKEIEPRLNQLIILTNDLIRALSDKIRSDLNKVPLIIIEDLDKLDISIAEDLYLRHKNVLTSLHVHIIYTFPIFLHYSSKFEEIKESFNHHELLSMIKVNDKHGTEYTEGINTITDILKKRAKEDLFETGVIKFFIKKSGGNLRNVFQMIRKSSLTSLANGQTKIDINVAKMAFKELKSDFERIISENHLDVLKKIYNDPQKKPFNDPNLMELLACTAVIEYNGDRWCYIHPAVKDSLKEKGTFNP